ncbi:MAG: carbon-phosphorus lyase complex subunit PhnI [Rhodospirillaceae bacterium]|jgi:alpha-D-ribose 1-methylphosphonate 5-triphosphate synthase subunit PhnI|nr:carbon-phosphorus lyase complex subunit PhnI [Rhodospirillaceae bacterium]MBT6138710.1 carbon-phosphorus lyase complex subunit PhnI [Rhodospirillaceae bacterium]
MYVAVKGGETAIENAEKLLAEERRGNPDVPEISLEQISEQLSLSVDRVMAEGSLHDRKLASLAIKQARGDLVEAIFLLRAYRTTLPRFGASEPLDTAQMAIQRRVSATFKDLPGGQILGPSFDYTHRLLDFDLAENGAMPEPAPEADTPVDATMPRVADLLGEEGLIEREIPNDQDAGEPLDLTRDAARFPLDRATRMQGLARGDEGFLLSLGYSTQRGYGRNHPFAGEIRLGEASVEFIPEELGFAIEIADITVTECQMVNRFQGSDEIPAQFTRGYGLVFGHNERKAMSAALVDRALRAEELGEATDAPAQDQEFVLSHADNVEASGFVQHLKLPHYVDFQSELITVRALRAEALDKQAAE